jgi:hypothetical protein
MTARTRKHQVEEAVTGVCELQQAEKDCSRIGSSPEKDRNEEVSE